MNSFSPIFDRIFESNGINGNCQAAVIFPSCFDTALEPTFEKLRASIISANSVFLVLVAKQKMAASDGIYDFRQKSLQNLKSRTPFVHSRNFREQQLQRYGLALVHFPFDLQDDGLLQLEFESMLLVVSGAEDRTVQEAIKLCFKSLPFSAQRLPATLLEPIFEDHGVLFSRSLFILNERIHATNHIFIQKLYSLIDRSEFAKRFGTYGVRILRRVRRYLRVLKFSKLRES